ncbi:ThuA domain-containing protein [Mariniblastus fucicola]|uniref:Trehalose utilization n=1 Tax=Mariniblastus fucicola TaxID=980251 RepID=A0A5B9PD60_9BACT|nr:ThuA domain-containing protein [Mariniblastus fucicola]QEG24318.1 Trehalose utilization [Mariniblastus fucicola]
MNRLLTAAAILVSFLASSAFSQNATLVFQDDFNRTESQETKDEPGNGWKTNSKNRAAGNKQVDLKDGAMYIACHPVADHGVSVVHDAPFRDGKLEIRFMLENEKDTLGLNFADLKYKQVHAGHLFKVTIGTKSTELADWKTGLMDLEIRKARQSNKLSDAQQEMLKTKRQRFKHPLETGKWYSAVVTVNGQQLSLDIDGKRVGSLSSPGIAHPTKRTIRLAVNKKAVVDDLKIWSHKSGAPLNVLLIAGGCCHDYENQTEILKQGIESRINAKVTVIYNPNRRTDTRFKIYESDDWAEGYDVILHDECCADVSDPVYVQRILAAHRNGTPAVNLHCAVHSYRWGNFRKPVNIGDDNASWYEMLGVQSSHHDHHAPIEITFDKDQKENPLIVGMQSWTTGNEELYNSVRVFDSTNVLASGKQTRKNGKPWSAAVVWTNEFGPNKTKTFTTSLGHYNETVKDDRYMELVIRGLLWTTGNLTEDGKPVKAMAK